MSGEQIWLIVGFIGQTIFASRFLIQWVFSERASKSIIPNIFWWIGCFEVWFYLATPFIKLTQFLL